MALEAKIQPPKLIILIVIDCLRADHLGCCGYSRNTSPTIDSLAGSGLLFPNCYPQGIYTFPSHVSLFTSIHHVSHGLENGDIFKYDLKTMPQYLQEAGYKTAGFISGSMLASDLGFSRGFDFYDDDVTIRSEVENGFFYWRNAENTTTRVIEWTRNQPDENAFLFIHFMDCHGPYIVPAEYTSMFLNDHLYTRQETLPFGDSVGRNAIPKQFVVDNNQEADFYVAQYDAGLRFIDDQLRLLMNELTKNISPDDMLFIVTGDHGEAMGEHGTYFAHGKGMYEEFIRVPLIISGSMANLKGMTIEEPVRHIDILPTILSWLKIQDIPNIIHGRSLRPLFEEGSEEFPGPHFDVQFTTAYIREGHWKYIVKRDFSLIARQSNLGKEFKRLYRRWRYPRQEELFNLQKDPLENVNLISGHKDVGDKLRKKLQSLIHEYRSLNFTEVNDTSIDYVDGEEMNRRMQALGYLDID